VAAVYRPADGTQDYAADLGDPGAFPFTRGVQPTMYRGRLWTMRQYAGFGTAAETNRRFKLLLDAGQTGLSVAFDLPTQMGIDSDASRALGEVGRVGVAIDTVDDMHALLADLPLDKVSTSMTINATASTLLAMYIVVAEERGLSRSAVSVTPPVCVWKRRRLLASPAPKRSRMSRAEMRRAARNFATSSNRSLCAAKKNESRGANVSIARPASIARFTYSTVLANVNASSCTAVAPASRIW
jgi:methylmalonyl-CoA mutase N-terminal domain/subunit